MNLPGVRGDGMSRSTVLFRWMRDPQKFLEDQQRLFGDVFTMRLPGAPTFFVFSNPEAVKQVFADDGSNMHAGEANVPLKPFLGEHSVLMLDGAEHMRQRKLLLPPFHGERMQAYGQTMLDLANASLDRWPIGRPFAVHGELQGITLRVIVRTVFGVDAGARFEDFCDKLARLTEVAAWPYLIIPALQRDLGPLSPWGRFQRQAAVVEKALMSEIRERRQKGTAGRSDVLSLLLDARDEAGAPMTDEELRDELVTLLVAGHETTATSLAWTLRYVLDRRDVLAKLTTELDAGPLTPERIAKLEYLDAVARETLRLQPVIPLVGRVLQRATTVGGIDLPAGAAVVCAIYLAHRRPEAYPDPTRFLPERFLRRKMTPNEFFPFGGGIRRCIGMAFALYEMKMVLAAVLSRARLRIARGEHVRPVRRSITMTPSRGLRVVADAVGAAR
jgi:cytochrome P450